MVITINETFEDDEFLLLKDKKNELQKKLKRTKFTWHDFILIIAGIDTNDKTKSK